METKTEIKKADAYVYEKTFEINKSEMACYYDIDLTDENGNTKRIYDNRKGDSILANFLRSLYIMMGRVLHYPDFPHPYIVRHTFGASQITSVSSGNGGVFRLTFNFTVTPEATGIISLSGFQGINLEGTFNYNRVSSSQIDILGTTFTTGWVSGTGGGIIITMTIVAVSNFFSVNLNSMFRHSLISVGRGTKPVAIDDQVLEKHIGNYGGNGGLVHNNQVISVEAIDQTSGQITATATFTNNGSVTIPVNEIGWYLCGLTFDATLLNTLMLRDVLPATVNVAPGQTLTVNYRIRTVLGTGTDPGGFIASFMRLLYRHIANTSRAAFNINGSNVTVSPASVDFIAVGGGGSTKRLGNEQRNELIGIVFGTSATSVSMEDYALMNRITHGTGANQLLYYGGFGSDFIIGSNFAEFSLIRVVENASGGDITIREFALYGGSSNSGSTTSYDDYVIIHHIHCISRNVLSSPITLENGKMLKFIYKIRISTSNPPS